MQQDLSLISISRRQIRVLAFGSDEQRMNVKREVMAEQTGGDGNLLKRQLDLWTLQLMKSEDEYEVDLGLRMLAKEYSPMVRNSMLRLFSGVSREDVDDMIQEATLKLYRNLDKYDPQKSSLGTWYYLLTYRRTVERFRRKRIATIPFEDFQAVESEPNFRNDEFRLELELCVEEIPQSDRDFLDIDSQCRSAEETAQTIGRSVHWVYSMRHRVRRAIRESLEERGFRA